MCVCFTFLTLLYSGAALGRRFRELKFPRGFLTMFVLPPAPTPNFLSNTNETLNPDFHNYFLALCQHHRELRERYSRGELNALEKVRVEQFIAEEGGLVRISIVT